MRLSSSYRLVQLFITFVNAELKITYLEDLSFDEYFLFFHWDIGECVELSLECEYVRLGVNLHIGVVYFTPLHVYYKNQNELK